MKTKLRILTGTLLLTALLIAFGCTANESDGQASAGPREVPLHSIDEFLDAKNFGGSSFSPGNEKILFRSDTSGVWNFYTVPSGGGEPTQITTSEETLRGGSYFPEDERFVYTMDQGGNEQTHVYVHELNGTATDLTPGEGLKANFLGWSEDHRRFYISSNERDARYFDLYAYNASDYARELLYQDETGYGIGAISRDERWIALSKTRTTNDSDVYLLDRNDGSLRHVTPHEGDASNDAADFSPDGKSLYLLTNEGSEFVYLAAYHLQDQTMKPVHQPEWDVLYAYFSDRGKYLVTAVNVDARTEITLRDAATMQTIELPRLPNADIPSVTLSTDEEAMAFYMSDGRRPSELWNWTIGSDEPTRLTTSISPAIDANDLVTGEVVRFLSYDGVEIPGILYKPHRASAEQKVPALVWVHGGPGGQSRFGYNTVIQYLVNHGYAVYAINNRGSSGYGKSFYALDDRRHGEADLGDCISSKQMLIDSGWVDADRIGIIGGSYGGYMVLAALAFEPDEFKVGVDLFGVANWVRTLESIPAWWESFREALYAELGDPKVDGERLRRISPLFHAGRIKSPLIVLQGANDPRVLKIESDEMVEAAKANGAIVEYLVFDDEGHGFRKKENQRAGYRAVLEFLDEHLMVAAVNE
jgi:dipeptidyl aminopeptidase/acylaminoacyl peptidase